jgi:hypothetical protein
MGGGGKTYRILLRKSEQKTPLRRPRCRREENPPLYLKEIEYELDG